MSQAPCEPSHGRKGRLLSFLSLIPQMLCPPSLSWEEHLVPIGWPLGSALLSTQPLLGATRDQGDEFSLPIGHSMTVSYYDTKNLNLVLRRMKQPRPSLCILCVYQDPRKCTWNGGFKGSWQPYPHVGPYVGPLRALRMLR